MPARAARALLLRVKRVGAARGQAPRADAGGAPVPLSRRAFPPFQPPQIYNWKPYFTLKDSVMDPSYDGPDMW